ncbi:MAG: glutaminase A [Candidatus Omnitrophica bacterium]|nr:glutaminase A [Candidatus Omnitrophota bacterium]
MKIIPDVSILKKAVEEAHKRFVNIKDGKNADYIPYLAKVPPQLFGIVIVTVDGNVIEAGDSRFAFAIESISKVFNMALVMEDVGSLALRKKIGADPTGEPFNSVMAIELHRGKPLNPCVNAGAMATVSLVKASSESERWARILENMSGFAGRPLSLNEEVYKSEAATNQHNRGIAWLLDSYGYMYSGPMEACDVYTKGCSVDITAVDLATMGATLAAGGINPITKKRVITETHVSKILAEITMNGLYDSTGDWQYKVGLPGKSGVGGGILAVVPGILAIGVFSPPLDIFGNSVRGQLAAEYLSDTLKLNLFTKGGAREQ